MVDFLALNEGVWCGYGYGNGEGVKCYNLHPVTQGCPNGYNRLAFSVGPQTLWTCVYGTLIDFG